MKTLILLLAITATEKPTMNLPIMLREPNYAGGSCVHASMIMLLRWQGLNNYANYWRQNYRGGETYSEFTAKLDSEGVAYAATVARRNVSFLEWSVRTRRGCMVTVMQGRHMVCLVYMDANVMGILDNNHIDKISYYKRDVFLKEWFNSNSWALVPLYSPTPPLPKRLN